MKEIDNCYAELFGAIWKQAVEDDIKIHTNKSKRQIQEEVYEESYRWKVRVTAW